MKISEEVKEKIVYLYTKSRKSIYEITKEVAPNGELTMEEVINTLEICQKESGKKLVREKYISKTSFKYKSGISNDEIEKLVNEGYTDREIAKYFCDKGIDITYQSIYNRKRNIFTGKGLPVPSIREKRKKQKILDLKKEENEKIGKNEELNKRIYYLRDKRKMSFHDIVSELAKDDIHIGVNSVKKRCEAMYKKENKEMYYLKSGKKKCFKVNPEKVFNLREQGCTSYEIGEFFGVPYYYILGMWDKIYKEKGMKTTINKDCFKIPTEKLVELKKMGFTYSEIFKFLQAEDVDISLTCISRRLKKYYTEMGEDITEIKEDNVFNCGKIDFKHIDKETLKKAMYYIKNTRNATNEQIYELYKCYGIELDDIIEAQVVDEKDFEDR